MPVFSFLNSLLASAIEACLELKPVFLVISQLGNYLHQKLTHLLYNSSQSDQHSGT